MRPPPFSGGAPRSGCSGAPQRDAKVAEVRGGVRGSHGQSSANPARATPRPRPRKSKLCLVCPSIQTCLLLGLQVSHIHVSHFTVQIHHFIGPDLGSRVRHPVSDRSSASTVSPSQRGLSRSLTPSQAHAFSCGVTLRNRHREGKPPQPPTTSAIQGTSTITSHSYPRRSLPSRLILKQTSVLTTEFQRNFPSIRSPDFDGP